MFIRSLPFYINALLTDTHTHISEIVQLTHPGTKELFNDATDTTFINNSLIVNHYIIFSSNERIKSFFEVS